MLEDEAHFSTVGQVEADACLELWIRNPSAAQEANTGGKVPVVPGTGKTEIIVERVIHVVWFSKVKRMIGQALTES